MPNDGRGADLLGLYWTVSGPVEVHVGREWSLFDLRDRCAQAARVGFSGIGLWHADLEHVLETRTLAEMQADLRRRTGCAHLELEFLWDWFLDPGDERRRASDRTRALLCEAADVLGAHHVKVGNIPGTPCELRELTERYAELCADAAEHHDAQIVYEFMPFDVNVHTLDAALAVVERRRRAERRPRDRHLAHVEARDPPEDLRRDPAARSSAGSSSPTATTRTCAT